MFVKINGGQQLPTCCPKRYLESRPPNVLSGNVYTEGPMLRGFSRVL